MPARNLNRSHGAKVKKWNSAHPMGRKKYAKAKKSLGFNSKTVGGKWLDKLVMPLFK